MKFKNIAVFTAALAAAATLSGCAAASADGAAINETQITEEEPETQITETPQLPEVAVPAAKPAARAVAYISVTADGVNLRTGAGASYAVSGTAEKNTLYAMLGEEDGWYKTQYRGKTVYLSKKYCVLIDLPESDSGRTEAVIAEGCKLLGTPYVYGATRLHDGAGRLLSGFSADKFDCSSLMQYIFYRGADKLLNVTTRTQVKQGTTVSENNLKRGDLMFFTNASRKNNAGIERVGHVALYLGDNWILHTASDYAKIERISATRWGYYIQSQRII